MTERECLLRAVCADPGDDTVRLAYADWLDEHGEPVRAEFIRVQVGLSRVVALMEDAESTDAERVALIAQRVRAEKLVHENREWLPFDYLWMSGAADWDTIYCGGGMGEGLGKPEMLIRRGFVDVIRCPVAAFLGNAEAIFTANPIARVELTDRQPLDNSYGPEPADKWFWVRSHPDDDPAHALEWYVPRELCGNFPPPDFGRPVEAHDWLSARCIAWGRKLASLSPLPVPA